MKKILLLQAVFLLSLIFISPAFSQSSDFLSRSYDFIKSEYGLDQKAIGELKIKNSYKTDHNNVDHVYLVQTFNGLEVFGTGVNLAFQNGKIFSNGHRLTILDNVSVHSSSPKVLAPQAIGIVANEMGVVTRSVPVITRHTKSGVPVYSGEDISLQDIPAELGYIYVQGEYHLAWKLQVESKQHGELYQSFVDAADGKLLANDALTLHCSFEHGYMSNEDDCNHHSGATFEKFSLAPPPNVSGQYRVLPLSIESPSHGNFELVTGIEDVTASPFGWHDVDGVVGNDYTITRGNNVHAFLDRNWDYAPDGDLDGGANLIFDFPFDINGEPSANQNVALTNLFFWNNVMHDFSYRYGFNEVAGNFQSMNYGAQGANEDYVEAHAQFGDTDPALCGSQANGDVACLNNADFSSPVDGFNGRMRMFTWDLDNSNRHLDVLEPVELSGKLVTGLADFGPDITTTPITGNVVIANDGSNNPSHACNSLNEQSNLNGKIALIDRGLCDFSEKVFNAQEGGAIGAIICNFEEATITMGAGSMAGEVTIPSVFISKGDCDRIRVAVASGLKVSLVAPPAEGGPTRRDGSLDNGIVAHEYGHGISTRLTGGPDRSYCLVPSALTGEAQEAWGMGEGWSDFFALAVTAKAGDTGAKKRGVGTYASKESIDGRGIRSFPYSTDMTINPHTYDDILFEAVPHGVGSVWSAMLWDLYWAFSDAYGWDPDLFGGTGGNNIVLQLVMDGLKLQPCNPGFIDARNAIIQADQINNNGVNECLIWEVFARRGLGWDADGGDPNLRSDGIAGFQTMPTCLKELKLTKTMSPEVLAGEQIEVTLHAINHTDAQLTNVFLEDLIPEGTTYVSGSANIEPTTGNSLVWSLDAVDPSEEITITYLLATDPEKNSVRLLFDDIEGDALSRWDVLYDEELFTDNFWTQQDILVHSGIAAWNVGDVAEESKHYLTNFEKYPVTGETPVYRFYHYYNTEAGADGGFLEISTNGSAWTRLEDRIFRNGYSRRLQYGTFAIPDLYAYSGLSDSSLIMTPVYVDLSDYKGQNVYIRYTFGTDDNTPGDGWYVDDVELMDAIIYNSTACITSDQTDPVCAEADERGTIVDSQIMSSSEDEQTNQELSVSPNPAGEFIQVILPVVQSGNADVKVFDLRGQQLHSSKWNLAEGINQHVVNIEGFTPGMYVIHISTGNSIYSQKFIKE